MKIVNVNKFYYLRGGAERYFFSLTDLLVRHGHEVIPFSMQHPCNFETSYDRYFPSYVEFGKARGVIIRDGQTTAQSAAIPPSGIADQSGHGSAQGGERREASSEASRRDAERSEEGCGGVRLLQNDLRAVGRMFWSFEAARKFDQLLTDTKPDLVHIHNIYHQLSPSILSVAKRHGIPVVMTLHDYKLIWPDYLLCGYEPGASYWNVVRERCTQGSYAKSLLVVFEKKLHDMLRVYEKNVDLFFTPSEFVKNILVERGQDEKKIRVLPHFVASSSVSKSSASTSPVILYFGRLSKEKGVDILLDMMHTIGSDVELRIAGEGPEESSLKSKVKSQKLSVTFVGQISTAALQREIDRALFIVAPSVVPETFGFTILESFARGKPVVASRIGAFPELVDDGVNGFLVPPNDAQALREKVAYLLQHTRVRVAMGKRARVLAAQYTSEHHYEQLIRYYNALL